MYQLLGSIICTASLRNIPTYNNLNVYIGINNGTKQQD